MYYISLPSVTQRRRGWWCCWSGGDIFMCKFPKSSRWQWRARRRIRGDGAVFVIVLDRPVVTVVTEGATHQLRAGKAVWRSQHARFNTGGTVRERCGVSARVIRYVRRTIGLRLRRRRRIGQRAHGAQHVAQQRVELVRRAGGGAASRWRNTRVHRGAKRRGGPAARAHYCRVDGSVERTESMRSFGPLSSFTTGAWALRAAVVLTYNKSYKV